AVVAVQAATFMAGIGSAALIALCMCVCRFSFFSVYCVKIFGAAHAGYDLFYISFGNRSSAFPYFVAHQLCDTALNIIDDFITPFFIRKVAAQAFNIPLQFLVSGILYRY